MYEHTHTCTYVCVYISKTSLYTICCYVQLKNDRQVLIIVAVAFPLNNARPVLQRISPRFKWTQISDVHCIRRRQALGRAATLLSVVWHEGHGGGGVDAETAQAKNS